MSMGAPYLGAPADVPGAGSAALMARPRPVDAGSVVPLPAEGFDELVRRAAAGDERAFDELVGPLVPKLHGYLRGIGRGDADELLNDVLIAVYRGLDRFDGSAAGFRSWVFTIAHNAAMDFHRRRRRRPAPIDTSDPRYAAIVGVLEGVDALVLDRVIEARLLAVLDRLPQSQRQVLLLRTVADMSVEETAHATGHSVGAVRVLQHRAIAGVRRRLEAQSDASQWSNDA